MIEMNQVSEFCKNRVIDILYRDGVNEDSLEMCGVGLASDEVSKGFHVQDHNDTAQVNKLVEIAPTAISTFLANKRQYCKLALTIFSYGVTDKVVENEITRIFGPEK